VLEPATIRLWKVGLKWASMAPVLFLVRELTMPACRRPSPVTVPSLVLLTVVGVSSWMTACGSGDSGSTDEVGGMPGASGAAGAAGVAAAYWPAATYAPGATIPADGYHTAAAGTIVAAGSCLATCHGPTGTSLTKFAFGGMIYAADGVTPASGVEVGVSDGTNKVFVYTATNGMYWSTSTAAINWPATDIRIRNAAGEKAKVAADGRNGDCDSCHFGTTLALKAP
jgi:hypothetical protein